MKKFVFIALLLITVGSHAQDWMHFWKRKFISDSTYYFIEYVFNKDKPYFRKVNNDWHYDATVTVSIVKGFTNIVILDTFPSFCGIFCRSSCACDEVGIKIWQATELKKGVPVEDVFTPDFFGCNWVFEEYSNRWKYEPTKPPKDY